MNPLSSAVLAVGFVLGLVGAAYVGGEAAQRFADTHRKVTVKGYAEKPVKSDVGVWRGTLTARARDLTGANAKLAASTQIVKAFLIEQKIDLNGVIFTAPIVTVHKVRGREGQETDQISSYELSQVLIIESRNVEQLASLALATGTLIERGVEFVDRGPEYYVSNIEDIKISLLGEATKNASKRAEEFAKYGGFKIGAMKSASQGVFQITQPNSSDVSGSGIYDTTSINKMVKLVITVEYSMERL